MDFNSFEGISLVVIAIIGITIFALYLWSIVWAYNDAKARNQRPVLVALMVALLSWPLGLLVWLVIRR